MTLVVVVEVVVVGVGGGGVAGGASGGAGGNNAIRSRQSALGPQPSWLELLARLIATITPSGCAPDMRYSNPA
jgi:hypothetical protein